MKKVQLLAAGAALFVVLGVHADQKLAPVVNVTEAPSQPTAAQMTATTVSQSGSPVTGLATPKPVQDNAVMPRPGSQAQVVVAHTNTGSLPQRVARLEQQMKNLTNMNMPEQVAQLQQQMQQIQGQLQVQAHDLKLLNQQQRSYYQDLDQRLSKLANTTTTAHNAANTTPTIAAQSAKSDGAQIKGSDAYQAAFNLLIKKQYPQAITAFNSYLKNYPKGRFLSNAHYWLGEIYSLQKQWPKAAAEFNTVITKFAKSNKVPDAKLKLAIVHLNEGSITQAKREFQLIKQQHPNSTAAQLAGIQLQRLNTATQ